MQVKLFETKLLGDTSETAFDFEIAANTRDKKRVIITFNTKEDLLSFTEKFEKLVREHNAWNGFEDFGTGITVR